MVPQPAEQHPAPEGIWLRHQDCDVKRITPGGPGEGQLRQLVEEVGIAASQPGGAAKPTATSRPSSVLSSASTDRARTRANRGRSSSGRSTSRCPTPGRQPRSRRAGSPGEDAGTAHARRHPRQRPDAGAAQQPQQHRLSLVVEGVAQQHRMPSRDRAARRASRAAASIPPSRPTCTCRTSAATPRALSASAVCPATSAEPGCNPWSTTMHVTSADTRGAAHAAPRARARESAPPETPATTGPPAAGPPPPCRPSARWVRVHAAP